MKKVRKKSTTTGSKAGPLITGTEDVDAFMAKLKHPLKAEMEAVRMIIKHANKNIGERVKWNSPSFYCKEDLATFHWRNQECIHIVFHHKAIVGVKSDLLEGDYKDRRMMYFHSMKEIKSNQRELERIMNELVKAVG